MVSVVFQGVEQLEPVVERQLEPSLLVLQDLSSSWHPELLVIRFQLSVSSEPLDWTPVEQLDVRSPFQPRASFPVPALVRCIDHKVVDHKHHRRQVCGHVATVAVAADDDHGAEQVGDKCCFHKVDGTVAVSQLRRLFRPRLWVSSTPELVTVIVPFGAKVQKLSAEAQVDQGGFEVQVD